MTNQPIKNEEYIFYVFLVSQSTGQFQSNPTIAAGDFKRSIDGAAYANFTNLPAVDPAGSKSVKITFTATEMNSSNLVWLASDAAGAEWDEVGGNIQPFLWISANDVVVSNMTQIDGQATSGYNATLKLKALEIINNVAYPVFISTSADGYPAVNIESTAADAQAVIVHGAGNGMLISSDTGAALDIASNSGNAINAESLGAGKSINAPQNIAVSDGDLTLAAIASAVWANVTRTLTSISDSSGITTLLSRIGSTLNISSGKVESNVKQINDTDVTGDGSGTPWGPA
jgi:hypothetical protein